DISNALEDSTVKINVNEQGINGNSVLKISYFNKPKLTAEFIYDKEIKRDLSDFLMGCCQRQNNQSNKSKLSN
ncbi:MAG TPA: hypothetical protein PLB87_12330, partial [Prolixibacteraceae bacterium]|nr:hypothetical protein [Prolixibacteraceae bacterium]